jgi:hypothetical protein
MSFCEPVMYSQVPWMQEFFLTHLTAVPSVAEENTDEGVNPEV